MVLPSMISLVRIVESEDGVILRGARGEVNSVSLFIWTYYGVAGNLQNQTDRLVTPVNMASIGLLQPPLRSRHVRF